ncbi:hypothetical protein BD413DRAFT_207456 [Trametes elegans]|nr:hypothetical protein BD413DRAFT_207456 [Trametes elegans]
MPYGEWWRKHRRAVWQYVKPEVAASYLAIQCSGARRFLAHVLPSPSQPLENLFTFSAEDRIRCRRCERRRRPPGSHHSGSRGHDSLHPWPFRRRGFAGLAIRPDLVSWWGGSRGCSQGARLRACVSNTSCSIRLRRRW